MDRDKRWERVRLAYELLIHGQGENTRDVFKTIAERYEHGETDEFLKPMVVVDDEQKSLATINEGDVVINFNFRTDRGREITMALTQQPFPEQHMRPFDLYN